MTRVIMASKEEAILYGPEQKPWEETISSLARSMTGTLLVTPPSEDPSKAYQLIPGLDTHKYQVPSTGLSELQQQDAQKQTLAYLNECADNFLGFQDNRLQNHFATVRQSYISPEIRINNAGDPFADASSKSNSKWLERHVLDYYASLWHAKWPHNPDDNDSYWGYVLTMGSSEGNMHAIWTAREYLSGKPTRSDNISGSWPLCPYDNPNALLPVAFYSEFSHNSISKSLDLMAVPSFHIIGTQKYPNENPLRGPWPMGVPTVTTPGGISTGCIDIEALSKLVDFFSAKGHPVLAIFNYGTTIQGAYDDVQQAGETLIPILKKNNMYIRKIFFDKKNPHLFLERKGFWFHVDGALAAAYMPFVEMAYEHNLVKEKPGPVFDFRLNYVSSIVTSGHKWPGIPYPAGIYITKTGLLKSYRLLAFNGALDSTISGSRNGFLAMLLWTFISAHSYETQVRMVVQCLQLAKYVEQKLKEIEKDSVPDLGVYRSPLSLAVLFRRPNAALVHKYTLCSFTLTVNGEEQDYCHIYIMPSVTQDRIDRFIQDLKESTAFSKQ